MGNLSTAFIFVVTLNLLFILAQASIVMMGAAESETSFLHFYNCEGTILGRFTQECQSVVNTNNIQNDLPSAANTPSTSGNVFTDLFTAILGFLAQIPGVNYVLTIATAPVTVISVIAPSPDLLPFRIIIGGFWYAISIFVIFAFAAWRD